MSDLAQITVTGRVTMDAELRYTSSGVPVLKFSVACNRWKGNATKTSFYDCEVWGKYGEGKSKVIGKGTHVIISGALDIDEFEGRNGRVRKPVITVSTIEPTPGQPQNDYVTESRREPRREQKPQSYDFTSGPEIFNDDIPF